ncbi:MAG: hypothetical protein U0169_20760 [Polyangiaceae bacterium]
MLTLPCTVTARSKNALILVSFLLILGVGVALLHPPRALGSVRSTIPNDSYLVATVDADALRASPIARLLPDETVTRVLGLRTLAEACGWDPASRLEEVALAVPENGETGAFGLAVRARVTRVELANCGDKLVASRGAHATTSKRGAFFVTKDDGEGRSKKLPALAVREDGVVLLAEDPWLSRMIDTAEGAVPDVSKNVLHEALRSRLAPDGAPLALVTAVLPKSLRDRLRNEMASELAAAANGTMDGVLSVEAAGVALRYRADGGDGSATLAAELVCESEAGARSIHGFLDGKRASWKQDLALRLVGVGRVADALELRQEGKTVRLSLTMPLADMVSLAERLAALRGSGDFLRREAPPSHDPAPAPPSPGPSMEVVPARPSSPKAPVH